MYIHVVYTCMALLFASSVLRPWSDYQNLIVLNCTKNLVLHVLHMVLFKLFPF